MPCITTHHASSPVCAELLALITGER